MRRSLFLRIVNNLQDQYEYFQQRYDVVGRKGLSPLQKCTAAMRMMVYGVSSDVVDDYMRIFGNTTIKCLKKFAISINEIFGKHYLRSPTPKDIHNILEESEQRVFRGMLGSIDYCMHLKWEKFPVAWQGMYTRDDQGKPTMILDEAVASYDLWIWHAYFGVQANINGYVYNIGYYLTDGIYQEWPVFVKTNPRADLLSEKRKLFARFQESARKDIERAIKVLQNRFAIVYSPARF